MTIVHPAEADVRRHAWPTSPTFHSPESLVLSYLRIGASLLKTPVWHYINERERTRFSDTLSLEVLSLHEKEQFPSTLLVAKQLQLLVSCLSLLQFRPEVSFIRIRQNSSEWRISSFLNNFALWIGS